MKKILIFLLTAALLCGCAPTVDPERAEEELEYTPRHGGSLKIYAYNSHSFNPLYTRNKANMQMLNLVFESLIMCGDDRRPIPILAESFSVSADGLEWRVNIRQGITWHDGSAFSAADAAASLNAVKSGANNSPYADNLSNVLKLEQSGNSLVIRLNEPQTNFINLLEIPIVKAASVNVYDDFHIVGTGKYTFAEKTNKIMYLTANNAWRGETTPYISNIEVHLFPDKSTSVYAFEAREIDCVTTDLLNWGSFSAGTNSRTFEYASNDFVFLAFNRSNDILAIPEVRYAFAGAVNKDRIYNEALLSHGVITNTFASPRWWIYNENTVSYEYDPGKSVTMISDLEMNPNDIAMSILVNNDNAIKLKVADILADNLMDIGIDMRVEAVSWEEFLERIARGSYDMYLGEIKYSPEINPKYILQSEEEFLPDLELLQLQTTDAGRKRVYDSLQSRYAVVLPAIPIYFEVEALLLNSKIKGTAAPVTGNMFNNIEQWFVTETEEG